MNRMKRIVYADYLRIVGILGVIGVHLSGNYLSHTVLFFRNVVSGTVIFVTFPIRCIAIYYGIRTSPAGQTTKLG